MNTWIKNSIFLGTILLMGMACYGQELTNEIAWNIKYGNTEQLEKLIAPEAINGCFGVADSKKYNYLAISVKLKSMKSLQYFIAKGADIEGVCADKTPLMYAAKYGPLEMVKYLVENGADLNARYRGKTALDFAVQYRHPDIRNFLKKQKIN
ncbi:MAG: ankyrin repeat domain-containing protein [Flavobacteriaceae bacterium]